MLNLFNEYKWIGIGIGAILWSIGVWHVAASYTENSYTKEKLELSHKLEESRAKDTELKTVISKALQESLASLRPQVTTINKEIQREILTNHVYTDCKSTDSLMQQYEHKLDLQ